MPRLLSLCCGAGGDSVGYYYAGFDVMGVDLVFQPFYPFPFIQRDALSLDYDFLLSFDAIHASPPCQKYCSATAGAQRRGKVYPDLYVSFRRMLIATGKPYIIENVPGSPARGIGLCGSMFGLGVRRHRIFESNIHLRLPETPCTCSQHPGEYVTVAGESFAKEDGAAAMGIDWPIDKFQLKEAVPPAYTEFLGRQLMRHLETEKPGDSVSMSRRCVSVSRNAEDQELSVSEWPLFPVSNGKTPDLRNANEQLLITVSGRRRLPVTRRCAACGAPLPQGTARRKYCNSLCRLHHFRELALAAH